MGRASTASGGRKRARDEDDVKEEVEEEEEGHHADTPRPATSSQIDAMLEQTMRAIVGARTYPSTACPSEVPRRLEAEQAQRQRRDGGDDDTRLPPWRDLMPATRDVARRLAREGVLQITQRGHAVGDLDDMPRGPIRLRPMPPTATPPTATATGTRTGGGGGRRRNE